MAGRRVRHDVADALRLMAFSAVAATGLAVTIATVARLA